MGVRNTTVSVSHTLFFLLALRSFHLPIFLTLPIPISASLTSFQTLLQRCVGAARAHKGQLSPRTSQSPSWLQAQPCKTGVSPGSLIATTGKTHSCSTFEVHKNDFRLKTQPFFPPSEINSFQTSKLASQMNLSAECDFFFPALFFSIWIVEERIIFKYLQFSVPGN